MGRFVPQLRTALYCVAFICFCAGFAQAPQISTPRIVDLDRLMGESFAEKLKQAYYQVMFNFTEEIDLSLYDNDNTDWELQFGRILLRTVSRPGYIVADHFSVEGTGYFPLSGAIGIGGNAQLKLMRFRPSPNAYVSDRHLKDDLKDWSANKPAADDEITAYQDSITPWIEQIESSYESGDAKPAKIVFGDDVPKWSIKDLIAGLKVPLDMPWTARRVLDDKKFKHRDIASYNVMGGVFARVSANMDLTGVSGPWAGVYLRGQFNYSILKSAPHEILLRIQASNNKGYNLGFDSKFQIPVLDGILFGNSIDYSVRPFSLIGDSYKSQLFSRIYKIDLANPTARRAYNAAVLGNLTLLDDRAKIEGSGVVTLSDRYQTGHHTRSRVRTAFWPVKLASEAAYDITTTDFWDERGKFKYHQAHGIKNSLIDFNLPKIGFRQQKLNEIYTQAYALSPDGPYAPRLFWHIEEINVNIKNHEADDLILFLEAFKPGASRLGLNKMLLKDRKARASVQIELAAPGFAELTKVSGTKIWQKSSELLFKKSNVWDSLQRRQRWKEKNGDRQMKHSLWPGSSARLMQAIDKLAKFHDRGASASDFKRWTEYSVLWMRADGHQPFFARLLAELLGPEHRYILLEVESESHGDYWFWESGDRDLTLYPDDWEYFTVPGLD